MEPIDRLFTAPRESYFLFGPGGTGKSTWLRPNYPDALYIDLPDQEVFRKYLAGPERLGDVISGSSQTKTVMLDEIQKVPSLLDEVHRLVRPRIRTLPRPNALCFFQERVADEHDSTARDLRTPQGAIRLRIHFSGTNMDTRLW
jgi:hypothetical protein